MLIFKTCQIIFQTFSKKSFLLIMGNEESDVPTVQLDDILSCPICYEVFRVNSKIKQCKEGHSICERCFGLITDCPVCRSRFEGTRNFTMEDLMTRLYEVDPQVIANSFASIRETWEKRSENDHKGPIKNLVWVPSSKNNFPSNAVLASYNRQGHPLYIGRVKYGHAIIPGKVNPRHKLCYFAINGSEHKSEVYDTLISIHDSKENCWISCSDGDVPNNAFPAGQTENGEVLYIGRAIHDGVLTHGRVQPSRAACYLPFYDEEVRCTTYEVFVDVQVPRTEVNREESIDDV